MTTNYTETVTSMISYIHTNSSSVSSSPSMSATPSPVYVPLLNPCPSLAPENPNIILVQRDYLYGSGMVILLIFFMNICYTNWLHGKYSALKKRPVVTNNSLV